MNKFFAKLAGALSLVALVAGAGVAVASGVNAKGVRAEATLAATFTCGEDGGASHADGSSASTYDETDGDYSLAVSNGVKFYTGARDAKGNGCWKFGTSSAVGSCAFTAPSDVILVKIYVAGYKANSAKISVNSGSAQTITTLSNNGEYTAVEVDTSSSKSVSFTTVTGGVRAMINTVEYYIDGGTPACDHDWEAGEVHAATCTENGYTDYECSLCGATKQDDVVPALGHDYGEWEEVTAPSCLVAGEERRVCSHDSSHVETRPIAALGHDYVDGICSRCGAEEPSETTVGYVFSEHYSANTMLDDVTIKPDENISIVFAASGTATQYYTNGTAVRWYSGATLTVSSSAGNIQSISITYLSKHDNAVSADVGSYTDIDSASGTATWVGDAAEVVFTEAGSSGHDRISELSITYDNGGTPVVTYTITYVANAADAEGSMSPTTAAAPEVASCAFTREGYEFARWNTQPDGEGDNYAVGTTVSEDITLYVIWQEYVPPIEGNISMEGVTSASAVTVNGHPALKCGAGSTAGVMKLILNKADITKIKVYVAGWKGDTSKTVNVEVTSGTATIEIESISLTEDSAITGSATSFTLNGAETTYVFTIDLVGASLGDEITFTAAQASKNRFVAWGATDLFAEYFANEFNSNLVCDASGEDSPSFKTGYDWTVFNGIYNGLDAQEQGRLHDADAVEGGSDIQDAMARYDYIEGKYNPDDDESSPWKNFIGRTVKPIENGRIVPVSNFADNSNSAMITITVIAITSLSAIAVLLVIKRRKTY